MVLLSETVLSRSLDRDIGDVAVQEVEEHLLVVAQGYIKVEIMVHHEHSQAELVSRVPLNLLDKATSTRKELRDIHLRRRQQSHLELNQNAVALRIEREAHLPVQQLGIQGYILHSQTVRLGVRVGIHKLAARVVLYYFELIVQWQPLDSDISFSKELFSNNS